MRERLTGWGRTAGSVAEVVRPETEADVVEQLAGARAVVARGLGRSYGDAAQVGGGVVLDNRGLSARSPVGVDGVVTLGAGVSIDELLTMALPLGWFVPVTPGTRQVTIGGAVAADVHGKNHHVDGSFANHVRAMRLVTPTGVHTLSRTMEPELFWATFGAMGLTGIVTEVTLAMLRVRSDRVLVDTDRFDDLDAVMAAMVEGDERYRYSVAWVDCMARGRRMGRSILTRGDHATDEDAREAPRAARLAVPVVAPAGLLNPVTITAFNELWFRRARHRVGAPESIGAFFHPLDGLRDWNRLYGPRGFVQYQFAVPERAGDTVVEAIRRLSQSRAPSFLAVLKRFGPANPASLSFPQPGWTLALDLPVGPVALATLLDELDELVVGAGGRVYLAKDSRLAPATVRAMYPRLGEFAALADTIDPERRLTSDLARRLRLREG